MLAYLEKLNMLATPVWMVAPESEMLIFSNLQAQFLSGGASLAAMRKGECSAVAHRKLTGYATSLKNRDDIIEVWSLPSEDGTRTLSCKLSGGDLEGWGKVIIFEGLTPRGNTGLKASRSAAYRPRKNGFYSRFFYTTSAPIVLVDPAREVIYFRSSRKLLICPDHINPSLLPTALPIVLLVTYRSQSVLSKFMANG